MQYCCNIVSEQKENITQNGQQIACTRSEVLMAVKMSIIVFRVVVVCSLVGGYQHFGRMYRLHLQLKIKAVWQCLSLLYMVYYSQFNFKLAEHLIMQMLWSTTTTK
jgi:hypothetical protein